MKFVAVIISIFLMALLFLQCGGSAQLSAEQFNALPSVERIAYLEKQVESNPNDLNLKRMLYREYLQLDMKEQAARTMAQLIELDPYQVDVQFEYGQVQYELGNSREAYGAFLAVMQSASAEVYKNDVSKYVAGKYLVQQLTSAPEEEAYPCFSPDGTRLIYQKKVGDNWDIYEIDLESKTERQVISGPADEELPAYAPQGGQLVFTSNAEDRRPIGTNYKVREITLMELSDNFKANLTQSVADDWLPRYSHTGNYMLFVSERDDLRKVNYLEKQSDLYIMESDGDFQHRLTVSPANDGGGAFSANDKKIYFHSNRNGTYDIMVMRTDGSQMMTIVDHSTADDVNPHASPVADKITFMTNRDGNFEIYMADGNGSNVERLTVNPAVDNSPVFSPDGQTIAFHSDRRGNNDLYLINLSYTTSVTTVNDLITRLNSLLQ